MYRKSTDLNLNEIYNEISELRDKPSACINRAIKVYIYPRVHARQRDLTKKCAMMMMNER